MIIISTSYDVPTSQLELAAMRLASRLPLNGGKAPIVLHSGSSVAARIQQLLAGSPGDDLAFYGHGSLSSMCLMAQDLASAIDGTTLHLLSKRRVCALSCHSTQILAAAVPSHAHEVVGYKGKLRIPNSPPYRAAFCDCVNAAPLAMASGQTAQAAKLRSEQEFRREARRLLKGTITDRVIGLKVFDANANQIDTIP